MANAGTTGGAGTGAGGTGVAGTAGTGSGTAGSGGNAGIAGTAGTAGTAGGGGSGGAIGVAGRGGGGGATGAAGSAGRGGASGTAGRGGASGTAGEAGGSGSAGRGGASGGAGRGGAGGAPGPECMTASDCKLVSDCCTCAAIPAGATAPACSLVCIQSQCDARQLPRGAVACVAGRCVAGFDCDTTKVTCRRAAPTCPAGEVPTVDDAGTCYSGACAPATQCTLLPDCAACTGVDPFCVSYQTQRGAQFHCVTVPPACSARTGCECLGPTTCIAPYRSCGDLSGPRGITCSCPNC